MKEINLKEILANEISLNLQSHGRSKEASDSVAKMSANTGHSAYILEAMKEAVKQALELAAENAEIDSIETSDDSSGFIYEINKQSILNIINQIKL